MEECLICYQNKNLDDNQWKKLPCNHKLCLYCFDKIINNNIFKCPFCRQVFNFGTNNKSKKEELYFEINLEITYNINLNRNRIRRRRRNLTLREIKERRDNIKIRCKKKWECKDKRLRKLKWYDFN